SVACCSKFNLLRSKFNRNKFVAGKSEYDNSPCLAHRHGGGDVLIEEQLFDGGYSRTVFCNQVLQFFLKLHEAVGMRRCFRRFNASKFENAVLAALHFKAGKSSTCNARVKPDNPHTSCRFRHW